jgi:DNA polymerase III subunit delta'
LLFKDIIGLQETKQTLVSSVQRSHVAHAQLFHGKNGAAVLPMALAYATFINCEDKQADDACGQCASCLKIKKLAHPDFFHIFPTAGAKMTTETLMPKWRKFIADTPHGTMTDWLASIDGKQGNISAEEARQLIQKLSMKPYEAPYKIILIWQPEAMSIAAANALLKVLEEPPSQTIFLLISNKVDALLTTILSRTQQIYIRQYTDNELVTILKSQGMDLDEAQRISYLADGDLNAIGVLKGEFASNQTDWFAAWMRMCYAQEYIKLVALADEFDGFSKEKQKSILDLSLTIFRDLFLVKVQSDELVRQQGNDLAFVQKFSKAMNFSNFETMIGLFSDAHYHIERNARAKILFLDLSLKMTSLIR